MLCVTNWSRGRISIDGLPLITIAELTVELYYQHDIHLMEIEEFNSDC